MATHKVKVIGPFVVAGIAPGEAGEIDDGRVDVDALVYAEHVEMLPEPEPEPVKPAAKKATAKKGDA